MNKKIEQSYNRIDQLANIINEKMHYKRLNALHEFVAKNKDIYSAFFENNEIDLTSKYNLFRSSYYAKELMKIEVNTYKYLKGLNNKQ